VTVALAVDAPVASVRLVPENSGQDYAVENGVLKTTVPTMLCHQMLEVRYVAPA
jgi:hypothetical protein